MRFFSEKMESGYTGSWNSDLIQLDFFLRCFLKDAVF